MIEAVFLLGNPLRGDDGAALALRDSLPGCPLRTLPGGGGGLELMEAWADFGDVVVVDTVCSGAPPGTLFRVELGQEPLPPERPSSTHALGLREAWELGQALGQCPRRVLFLGVEGRDFDMGAPLSEEVRRALPQLQAAIEKEVLCTKAT